MTGSQKLHINVEGKTMEIELELSWCTAYELAKELIDMRV